MGSMPLGRGVAVNRDQKADLSCLHAQRDKLFTSMPLGNAAGTEIRTRLRLRSTCPGANNRLDVASIFSFDRGTRAQYAMPGAPPWGVLCPGPLDRGVPLADMSRPHPLRCA